MKKNLYKTLILDVMGDRHLTAEEIFLRLRKKHDRASMASVYRNLEQLVEEEEISKWTGLLEGVVVYEKNIGLHGHLVIEGRAGVKIFNFPVEMVGGLAALVDTEDVSLTLRVPEKIRTRQQENFSDFGGKVFLGGDAEAGQDLPDVSQNSVEKSGEVGDGAENFTENSRKKPGETAENSETFQGKLGRNQDGQLAIENAVENSPATGENEKFQGKIEKHQDAREAIENSVENSGTTDENGSFGEDEESAENEEEIFAEKSPGFGEKMRKKSGENFEDGLENSGESFVRKPEKSAGGGEKNEEKSLNVSGEESVENLGESAENLGESLEIDDPEKRVAVSENFEGWEKSAEIFVRKNETWRNFAEVGDGAENEEGNFENWEKFQENGSEFGEESKKIVGNSGEKSKRIENFAEKSGGRWVEETNGWNWVADDADDGGDEKFLENSEESGGMKKNWAENFVEKVQEKSEKFWGNSEESLGENSGGEMGKNLEKKFWGNLGWENSEKKGGISGSKKNSDILEEGAAWEKWEKIWEKSAGRSEGFSVENSGEKIQKKIAENSGVIWGKSGGEIGNWEKSQKNSGERKSEVFENSGKIEGNFGEKSENPTEGGEKSVKKIEKDFGGEKLGEKSAENSEKKSEEIWNWEKSRDFVEKIFGEEKLGGGNSGEIGEKNQCEIELGDEKKSEQWETAVGVQRVSEQEIVAEIEKKFPPEKNSESGRGKFEDF